MLLDNTLLLADTVTTTTSAASTSYVDCLTASNDMAGSWLVAKVESTAFAVKNGTPTVVFELQTADNTSFAGERSSVFTLCCSAAMTYSYLTANSIACKVPIPPGALRYLRGYYSVSNYSAGSQDFSACSYSMFIVNSVDTLVSGRQ